MDLQQAIKTLGGVAAAAKIIGVHRTNVYYWLAKGAPKWRQTDVEKLIKLAEVERLSKGR